MTISEVIFRKRSTLVSFLPVHVSRSYLGLRDFLASASRDISLWNSEPIWMWLQFPATQRSESNGLEKSVTFDIRACRQRNPRALFSVFLLKV
jgi:hypothetical protein